jgi:serine/threonine-protein kinase
MERIGKYEIISLIGAGGMGTVYRARIVGPGQATKEVAIKLLHPHLSRQPDFVELFLNEMRLAMALSHRNIVQTFDAGTSDERYFMVMEYVDGSSLRALLKQLPEGTRLPLRLSLFIGREIATALGHAHELEATGQEGIIHRDVCPNNILLSRQGDVKLTDFGIARAFSALETTNSIRGKLKYMAPEQARGVVDPRADLFSLGAVLFELLSGTPLRTRTDLLAIAQGDTGRQERLRELPTEVADVVASCVAADPGERPQRAAELASALDALIRSGPTDDGVGSDLHQGLGEYLAARIAPPDQAAGRLEAQRALHDLLVAEAPTKAEPVAAGARARPRPNLAVVVAAVVLLLAGAAIGLYTALVPAAPGRPEAAPSVARPDRGPAAVRARATPDAGRLARSADLAVAPRPAPAPRDRRPGSLSLTAVPWAWVFLDGRRLGETPIQNHRLSAGSHTLRLVNPALKVHRTLTIRVRPGEHVKRSVVF